MTEPSSVLKLLQRVAESELRSIVRDLLVGMGYERVTITHGSLELGRDIVFLEVDRLGRSVWRGAQVKSQPLSGRTDSPQFGRTVVTQCETALENTFTESGGQEVFLSEMWFVTPFPLTEEAKQALRGKFRVPQRVEIVDGPRLETLATRFMPALLAGGLQTTDEYLDRLMAYCDSPEQFVVEQLQATFSLSSVYVPPISTISFAPLDEIASLEPGVPHSCASRLNQALEEAVYAWTLGRLSQAKRSATVSRCKEVADAIASIHDLRIDAQIGIRLRDSFEALMALTPFAEVEQTGPFWIDEPTHVAALSAFFSESSRDAHLYLSVSEPRDVVAATLSKSFDAPTTGFTREHYIGGAQSALSRLYRAPESSPVMEPHRLASISNAMKAFEIAWGAALETLAEKYCQAFASINPEPTTPIRRLENQHHENACFLNLLTSWWRNFVRPSDAPLVLCECDPVKTFRAARALLIVGELGKGKTTTLKRIANALAIDAKRNQDAQLPAFVSLGSVAYSPLDFSSALLKVARHGSSVLEGAASRVWLMDGLDENESTEFRATLLNWCAIGRGRDASVVISSRPAAARLFARRFVRMSLIGFDAATALDFVARFPWQTKQEGEQFACLLVKTPELQELARTPLLLTLMAVLATRRGIERLPKRREVLYDLVVRLILGEWDASKKVPRSHALEVDGKVALLAKVAFELYSDHKRFFSETEFAAACERNAPTNCDAAQLARGFWDELVRDCMIVPAVEHGSYAFLHLSIQEYLAAFELEKSIGFFNLNTIILEYLDTGWWEEVLVFYAGIKRDITELLQFVNTIMVRSRAQSEMKALLVRWRDVADFTRSRTVFWDPRVVAMVRESGWQVSIESEPQGNQQVDAGIPGNPK